MYLAEVTREALRPILASLLQQTCGKEDQGIRLVRIHQKSCVGAMLLAAVGLVVAAGCRRDHSRAHNKPIASATPSATQSPPKEVPVAPVKTVIACTQQRTSRIDYYSDSGVLQNLRVAANSEGALLTWERLNQPDIGDSSQLGFGAATANGGADLETVVLPARAYASAMYTTLAPSTIEGHLDFVAYGVAGGSGFRAYSTGLAAWKGVKVFEDFGPKPWLAKALPFMLMEELVVAANVPLAAIAGIETPCANRYDCIQLFEPVEQQGFPKSLRSLSLVGKQAHSEILFKGTITSPKKSFAPSVATSGDSGFVAFRVDDKLKAQWMTLNGKPDGEAIVLGLGGDIGAPAVAFAGKDAFVVWAYRARATDAYQLWIARVANEMVDLARPLDTGTGNAFAPGIAAQGDSLVVVWMDGDGGKKGIVRLGRIALSDIVGDRAQVTVRAIEAQTPDEGNHRDPEVAVSGDHVYVTWSDFTTNKAGVPVLRILNCAPGAKGP
jgi:hypothetical protein